ncbi:hypothetical protein FGF1_03180 [Flavobacteriaceae bacterium GF1]
MNYFAEIAKYLSNPLVLIGFGLLIFLLLFRSFIKNQIQKLRRDAGEKFIFRLLNYITLVIILLIVLGFLLEYIKIDGEREKKVAEDENKTQGIEKLKESLMEKALAQEEKLFKFLPIEGLDEKVNALETDNSAKEGIELRFKSKEWEIDCKFKVDDSLSLFDLKQKLIGHFDLKGSLELVEEENALSPMIIWNIHLNNLIIDDESQTLKSVGARNNDLITLSVIGKVLMIEAPPPPPNELLESKELEPT